MSTVLYTYRIKKSDFWSFFEQVRRYYLANSTGMELIKHLNLKVRDKEIDFAKSGFKMLKEFSEDDNFHCRLQVFDRNSYYLFRVLEAGYQFMNNREQWRPQITDVFYDSRTDIPKEERRNGKIADWIDVQIRQRKYFIAHVLGKDDLYYSFFRKYEDVEEKS